LLTAGPYNECGPRSKDLASWRSFTITQEANVDGPVTLTCDVIDGNGGMLAGQTLVYTIDAVNDLPVITSGTSATVVENTPAATVIYDADAVDAIEPEQTISFSLSGDDALRFDIVPLTGEARFNASPDHDAPLDLDGDNVYDAVDHAKDGFDDVTQAIEISVTNVGGQIFTGGNKGQTFVGTGEEEVLSGGKGSDVLDGAGGNDTIEGGRGRDTITGGAGNDTMMGGNGNDTFIFAFGAHVITDFDANPRGRQDLLDISAFEIADLGTEVVLTDDGSDTLVTIGSDTIRLTAVDWPSVTTDDFIV
jgi:Ca2+-binding RTX toxin-like protein